MKTNRRTPLEREMLNLFREIYHDEASQEEAVRDSMKAYSYIKQDVLKREYNQTNLE